MKRRVFMLAVAVIASGCVSVKLVRTVYTANVYATDPANVNALAKKTKRLLKLSVVNAEPSDPNSPVNKVPIRKGMLLISPSGTFSSYLHDAMIKDLTEAGLYSAKSVTRVRITLLKNQIDAPFFSKGTESMKVRLHIFRGHRKLLDKTYSATIPFDTHLSGAASGQAAIRKYAALVHALFSDIYHDQAFITAIKR